YDIRLCAYGALSKRIFEMARKPSGRPAGRAESGAGSEHGQAARSRTALEASGPTIKAAVRAANGGAKSLMKTSELGARGTTARSKVPVSAPVRASRRPVKRVTHGASQNWEAKIEERIVAATEEMASGLNEAASAAEEL